MYKKPFPCLLITLISCSFPGRKLTGRIERLTKNGYDLKAMIMDELPSSTVGYAASHVDNVKLKIALQALNVSEISITYKAAIKPPDTLPTVLPFLGNDLDSTITISWIKQNGDQVKYNCMYYFFGSSPPSHQVLNTPSFKDVKINDSIWIQKRVSDIIIVY